MINRKRIIVTTLGTAAAIALVLTQTAESHRQYRLGGNWIGGSGGNLWTALHTPLDPEARTDASRVHFVTYNADFAAVLSTFGADSLSDAVGQGEMISRDTCKWTLMSYALKQGNPPLIQAIGVGQGTWQFISPDSAVVHYTNYMYLPTADADGDGFPDAGSTPVAAFPVVDTAQRVVPPAGIR